MSGHRYPLVENRDSSLQVFYLKRQKAKSAILFIFVSIVCACLIAYLFKLQPPVRETDRYSAVGDFPPDHAWFNTGSPISLYEDLQGHVVVVLFCSFSLLSEVQNLDGFEGLLDRYTDEPVALIIVFIPGDSSVESWRTSIENWGVVAPVIVDHDNLVSQSLLADRYPMVEVIDSRGRIAGRYFETWSTTDLYAVVNDVLMLGRADRSLASDTFEPEPGEFIPSSLAGE